MFPYLSHLIYLNILLSWLTNTNGHECQVLSMCKCSNFPLFTLIDTSYLSKPRSILNQDLFCAFDFNINRTTINTFEQFKYFYYRFRTLTFANYPIIPSKAFRFVHFESQSVKQTHKDNNRNIIAFVNIQNTEPDIFQDLSLLNSEDQLIILFLNSPLLQYTNRGLANLRCYELKFINTNPKISIDFFTEIIFINHLIIDNPSFSGFDYSTKLSSTFSLNKLSIKDISVSHLKGKHFPIRFSSVKELILENYHINRAFRSLNNYELAQQFPQLCLLKIYSRSIKHLSSRMFEYFTRLEYLIVDGIETIANDAFFDLYHLKQLNLGKSIRQIDSLAFIHMNTEILLLNQSYDFRLDDKKDFCTFAQFSPLRERKNFVQFPKNLSDCSCTLRYLYRHIDKSLLSLTPNCYFNSSLYVLTQEERICYFEQRLLQCQILPDEGLIIYGKHYNTSYFYQQQLSKRKFQWTFFFRYRIYYFLAGILFLACLYMIFRQQKQRENSTYRHLHRLLKRQRIPRTDNSDVIYEQPNNFTETTVRVTKL